MLLTGCIVALCLLVSTPASAQTAAQTTTQSTTQTLGQFAPPPPAGGEAAALRSAASTDGARAEREQRRSGPTLAQRFDEMQDLQIRDAWAEINEHLPEITIGASIILIVLLIATGVMRPGGFKRIGVRDVKPYPFPVWIAAGVIIYLFMPLGADAVSRLPWLVGDPETEPLRFEAVTLCAGAGAAALVGLCFIYLMSRGAKEAGMRVTAIDPFTGVLCFLIALPLVQAAGFGVAELYARINAEAPPRIAHDTLATIAENASNHWVWLLIFGVVVLVPIAEELVFRMGLQSGLLRMTGSPWIAVLLTSVVFTLAHVAVIPAGSWHAYAQLFVLSVAIGISYERTKSLGVPIAMHMLFNGLTIALTIGFGDPSMAEGAATARGG